MTLIAIIITLLYLALIGSFIYGFDKVEDFVLKDLKPKTKFSILIPFRNEEKNLPALLESISKLNYPTAMFELIFIDDASEDASMTVLATFKSDYDKLLKIRILSNVRLTNSPKKDAITLGISTASFDWIVTTDADCVLPKFWLDSFDEFIQIHQPEFIVGPITYSKIDTFLARFQLLDVLSLQGSTIGGFGIQRAFLCNGANLAYKKQTFETVNGFQGNTNIASGDDIFMLEKTMKIAPDKVKFLKCEQAIVTTLPQTNFDNLLSQRIRWAAKSTAYKNLFAKLVGIIVFLMNGGLLVFGLFAVVGIIRPSILFYVLVIKFGIDFLLLFKTANFYNQKDVLKSYVFAFFTYPIFTVYVVFASFFRGYKWKGRKYDK